MYHDFSEITFADFVACVDADTMTKCLKWCFKDAAKDTKMGRITFRFKDGNFGVEIMSLGSLFNHGSKWWREAFVKTADLKDDGNSYNPKWLVTTYNYSNAYHKSSENGACTFQTQWGDLLKAKAPEYIAYLKKNYKAIYD